MALKHPWVTWNFKDPIPKSYIDEISDNLMVETLGRVQK